MEEVVVIGAGPGGLAVAGSLRAAGVEALVVEEADAIGATWRRHYDRLHLHTARGLSGLPGFAIPRRHGRWVSRRDLVDYLEQYAEHHRLRIRTGVAVQRIDDDPEGWRLRTGAGDIVARSVVVATGYNREPVPLRLPGLETFRGLVVHSADYRNGTPYRGRDVIVVGSGNSGTEISVDLAEAGAKRVFIAVRTPPNIQRRSVLGLPTQVLGILLSGLPGPVIDRLSLVMQAWAIGDLQKFGLPRPGRGVFTRLTVDERIPVIDAGFIAAVKRGAVEVVPAVESFDREEVVLADGRRLQVDVVIAATGYRRGLEGLVGHLGVLLPSGGPRANGAEPPPGFSNLYFIGYTNPLGGNLREMAIDARRIAARITTTSPVEAGRLPPPILS